MSGSFHGCGARLRCGCFPINVRPAGTFPLKVPRQMIGINLAVCFPSIDSFITAARDLNRFTWGGLKDRSMFSTTMRFLLPRTTEIRYKPKATNFASSLRSILRLRLLLRNRRGLFLLRLATSDAVTISLVSTVRREKMRKSKDESTDTGQYEW